MQIKTLALITSPVSRYMLRRVLSRQAGSLYCSNSKLEMEFRTQGMMNPKAQYYSALEEVVLQTTKKVMKRYISRMPGPDDQEGKVEHIVDVGCGSGRATKEAVLESMPRSLQVKITALDKSVDMIRIARKKCAHPSIEFVVADITENWHSFPTEWRGKFSKAFAHFSLHWLPDLGMAMRNISNILRPGGFLLAQVVVQSFVFHVAKDLRKNPKWSPYCKGKLPPLIECNDPSKGTELLLKSFHDAGLHVTDTNTELVIFELPDMNSFKDTLRSLGPFYSNIPDELKEEYVEEYAQKKINILGKRGIQANKLIVLARKVI